jgi:dTDP-glucose pyrophosphorylase
MPKADLDLSKVVLPPESTIRDGMRLLDQSGLEVVLVCDADRRLLEVVTDGDIRKALLRGVALDEPIGGVGNANFIARSSTCTRAEIVQTMVEHSIKCVPVVDERGRLVWLHTLHAALSAHVDSWAVIIAGGKGERLGELTHAIPKPMLPIGDRPLLERIVHLLVSHGIRRIFISVNYLGDMIVDHFLDGSRFHCSIEYLREIDPLGTGGPLSLLPERPTRPVVVMNGDLLTSINVTRLLDFHEAGRYAATMVVRDHRIQVPFGVAELDGNCVARVVEKPSLSYHINTGIYVLEPEVIDRVPHGRFVPITDVFNRCIHDRLPVGAFHLQEQWHDVGVPDEYHRLNRV